MPQPKANDERFSTDDKYELPSNDLFETFQTGLQRFLRDATATTVTLVVLSVLQLVAILASQSRGAFVAALAGIVCVIVATSRKGKYAWSVPLLLIATVAAVLFLDHLNLKDTRAPVYSRSLRCKKAHSRSLEALEGERSYRAALSAWRLWTRNLLARLPSLPISIGPGWFYNADNMYCEWFVEGGLWLLPLIALELGASSVRFADCDAFIGLRT